MNCAKKLEFDSLMGKKILLYGETNTYKTYCTACFAKFLLEEKEIEPNLISILEFAPNLQYIKQLKIGGKIKDYYEKSLSCNYLDTEEEIIPPRLNANNRKELYHNACHNFKQTRFILQNFNNNPTPIVLINDISIYLHLGDRNNLIKIINESQTFFGNAYFGKNINQRAHFATIFSLKEYMKIKHLHKNFDKSILMKESN
ncbi:MAG: hypothetical protein GF329_03625 [Candidatus Lokiarchaeota archaeon]|nr:hypothetical protein [Candidatus Lokiarchaeota archaeon]